MIRERVLKLLLTTGFFFGSFTVPSQSSEQDYLVIKSLVREMVSSGSIGKDNLRIYPPEWKGSPDNIFLYGCSIDLNTEFGEMEFVYQYIALQVEVASSILTGEGYPEDEWRSALESFEAAALKLAEEGSDGFDVLGLFASTVGSLSDSLGVSPTTGRIIDKDDGGDCGDGGFTVTFVSDPPSARLWIIYEFDFRLCELRGVDPWTNVQSSECPWIEQSVAIDGIQPTVFVDAGNYRFFARWPDGHEDFGRRRLQATDYTDEYGDVVVLTR